MITFSQMRDAGLHWFDTDTMNCFGTELGSIFEGSGGVFFTTCETEPASGQKKWSIRQWDAPEVRTVEFFKYTKRQTADNAAEDLANADV